MIDPIIAYLQDIALLLVSMPINWQEKFYVVYLLTFIGLAYLSYRLYYPSVKGGFPGFVFPREIYLHPSARIDYGIFLINVLISPWLLVGAGLQAWLSIELGQWLVTLNNNTAIFTGQWSPLTYAFFILGYTLTADFSVYLVHRFHHSSAIFWPLHSLHHSAEVMTPVTLFRKHPLWNIIARVMSMLLTGLFQGIFVFVFLGGPGIEILFGLNTIYVVYNFFGANLRHSHIWLSWGRPLSHVFISPAMHQIHHDPNRMRKNYGEIFALWDWAFGTLYIPRQRETFEIGLGEGKDNPHDTLAKAYYVPVVDLVVQLQNKLISVRKKLTSK